MFSVWSEAANFLLSEKHHSAKLTDSLGSISKHSLPDRQMQSDCRIKKNNLVCQIKNMAPATTFSSWVHCQLYPTGLIGGCWIGLAGRCARLERLPKSLGTT